MAFMLGSRSRSSHAGGKELRDVPGVWPVFEVDLAAHNRRCSQGMVGSRRIDLLLLERDQSGGPSAFRFYGQAVPSQVARLRRRRCDPDGGSFPGRPSL
jgi:hypothetical protein